MASVVADTHAIVWYVEADPRLSPAALQAIEDAARAGDPVFVSAVTFAEVVYLEEKGRVRKGQFDHLRLILTQSGAVSRIIPFDADMADAMRQIPAAIVPDMPDRMIGATALHLGLPLVTADRKLRAVPALTTIW